MVRNIVQTFILDLPIVQFRQYFKQRRRKNGRWSLVLQCFRVLETVSEENKVVLIWVPGHSEILGNELADEFARNVSGTEFIGSEPAVGGHVGSFKV